MLKNVVMILCMPPNIICKEEFPTDYIALKKRQCKWTQGNVEYMKKYSKNIKNSGMSWYEKLDIKLSHYSLPIVPMLSLLIIISTLSLGFLNSKALNYSIIIFGLSILFLLSPLLPNIFVYGKSKQAHLIVPYYILSMATYTSLTPMMIKTVTLAVFGKKAKFIVTPKTKNKISLSRALKFSIDSLCFALIIGVATYFSFKNILPSLIIIICCSLSPFVILLANITTKKHNKIKTQKKLNNIVNFNSVEPIFVVKNNLQQEDEKIIVSKNN